MTALAITAALAVVLVAIGGNHVAAGGGERR
jgi:hypothetical protein